MAVRAASGSCALGPAAPDRWGLGCSRPRCRQQRSRAAMSRRFFRRAWRIAGVVGIVGLTVPMSPAGAESLRYQASAGADGARLSVTIPGATVVDQVIDGGGPTAQAAVSSLGGSSALAAQPYPGELAIIGPGLGASLIGAPQPP